ncbi:heavy metal-associated isoprenylated plant protein 39-like [Zingiber officinale]|uniref:heavy metal-associated isoprenylated plant protein 39-like n=1 Tax=Zingiber officinale TaxID=94328 RepID=UPI001C4D628E|nr:heavy metal-associated isoprenylated plant protein 39-like [Zingiber officinale]
MADQSKKLVLKLELRDEKDKKKAMKAISGLPGIDSISIDMKDQKLTITGTIDPITVVAKLRKSRHAELLSVGPAKEEKKKEEPKKEEPKKEEKKEGDKDKEKEQIAELIKAYQTYNPHLTTHYYMQSAEENPNACVVM